MSVAAPAPPKARPLKAVGVAPRRGPGEGLAIARDAFTVLSIVTLWIVAQVLFLGGLSQSRAQTTLYDDFRTQLAGATAPIGGAIDPGVPVALLRIPAIGLDQVVVEGTASGDLLAGPGHRRDTALPGQEGVSLLYGRARSYGAPFADLAQLEAGQPIVVRTQQGKATFRVDGVRRAGDPVPPPPEAGGGRLTLVSAEGSGTLSMLGAGSTIYVDATLVSKAFVAPPERPLAVPDSEQTMAVDPSALPLLTLCLAGVLASLGCVVLARQRLALPVVWVLASPVLIALAWQTTDIAMRLLPNLM